MSLDVSVIRGGKEEGDIVVFTREACDAVHGSEAPAALAEALLVRDLNRVLGLGLKNECGIVPTSLPPPSLTPPPLGCHPWFVEE